VPPTDNAAMLRQRRDHRGREAAYRKLDAVRLGPVTELGVAERIDVPAARAGVDAVVDGVAPIDGALVAAAPGSKKGLLGVEYLLFDEAGAGAALARLASDGAPARRRTFARAMAEEIAHQLQARMASTQPDMILELAHVVARDHQRRSGGPIQIYADAQVSFNGRPRAPMVAPRVDFAREEDGLGPRRFVLPDPTGTPEL
jgi:hypothetical protein